MVAALLYLVTLTPVAPPAAALVFVVASTLARTVYRVGLRQRVLYPPGTPRRRRFGPALARLPLDVAAAFLGTVVALLVPVAAATGVSFLVAGAVAPPAPPPVLPGLGLPLLAAGLVGTVVAWRLGGRPLRTGSRVVLERVTSRPSVTWGVVAVLAFFVVASIHTVVVTGGVPDWRLLTGPTPPP